MEANADDKGNAKQMSGFEADGNSTSFCAYPIEYSSELLNNENGVLFMPLTPTDLPLSVASTFGDPNDSRTSASAMNIQPTCHGFIFPYSENEQGTSSAMHSSCQNQAVAGENESLLKSAFPPSFQHQFPSNINSDAETQLQMFLLQQLIALQLASITGLKTTSFKETQMQPPSNHAPVGLPSTNLPSTFCNDLMSSERYTFLVPVEATLKDSCGLSLHITPRTEFSPTAGPLSETGMKMECASDQLVLHPYSPTQVFTNENAEPYTTNTKFNFNAPQTMTINDIKSCIRRGSLDIQGEHNNYIVDKIKDQTKPGFVLLSVQREKITPTGKTVDHIIKRSSVTNMSSPSTTVMEDREKISVNPSSFTKKVNKRRQRLIRSESDPQKRSMKKATRFPLKQIQEKDTDCSTTLNTETSVSASRFRVSRFADKKQAWIAPSKSGCFIVHDLWTKNLPDYVLSRVDQLSSKSLSDTCFAAKLDGEIERSKSVLGAQCKVCQLNKPYSCECPHPEYVDAQRGHNGRSFGQQMSDYMSTIFDWINELGSWSQQARNWCSQSNVYCPEHHRLFKSRLFRQVGDVQTKHRS
ncbi:hypothetical protein EG68_10689 [Paragonimus skrjabini miyazakii]|uniref:Uncharacterized protein n=1 Tax=Paragonimus skrjabini miyazakii TaxID=59628 RepID=A0A8S9YAU8_9TREM|nr:hypothetical protein EG68_10689 [Paragonimus skrjabini miyazakii]